jgi:hypothetical protein
MSSTAGLGALCSWDIAELEPQRGWKAATDKVFENQDLGFDDEEGTYIGEPIYVLSLLICADMLISVVYLDFHDGEGTYMGEPWRLGHWPTCLMCSYVRFWVVGCDLSCRKK